MNIEMESSTSVEFKQLVQCWFTIVFHYAIIFFYGNSFIKLEAEHSRQPYITVIQITAEYLYSTVTVFVRNVPNRYNLVF